MEDSPRDPQDITDGLAAITELEQDFVHLLTRFRRQALGSAKQFDQVGRDIGKSLHTLRTTLYTSDPALPRPTTPKSTRGCYSPEFEAAWLIYPHPPGDSKQDAGRCYEARRKEGHSTEALQAGIVAYRAYCEAQGWGKTKFCKQGATFFGPSLHFLSDWSYASIATVPRRLTPAEITQQNLDAMLGSVSA